MTKRRYSDEDRAAAVAAVTANGGNVQRTARQLGIPETSLRQWVKAERHPEAAQMSVEKRGTLADEMERVVWKLVEGINDPEKVKAAPVQQLATAAGILVDKIRLLRGEPTAIDEHRDDDRLAEYRRRYLAAHGDHAAVDDAPDGAGQQVHPPRPHGAPDSVPGTGVP
jgi:transposase-like protein